MNVKAESRELFWLDNVRGTIRGTYHRPSGRGQKTNAEHHDSRRVGVIFLSGLATSRSANGDVAAYWGDKLAERGYPFFRIDLPGYGDAGGDPPADWAIHITHGKDGAIAATAIREISARFKLSQVVIVGHCSGAVAAIFSAAKIDICKGLVLMDPFFQPPFRESSKVRMMLSSWSWRLGMHWVLRDMHQAWKQLRCIFGGSMRPANVNMRLAQCWRKVAAAGLPALILSSPGWVAAEEREEPTYFDYAEYFREMAAGGSGQLSVEIIKDSHHSFANRVDRTTVLNNIENWLSANFPLDNMSVVKVKAEDMEMARQIGTDINRGGSRAEYEELTR